MKLPRNTILIAGNLQKNTTEKSTSCFQKQKQSSKLLSYLPGFLKQSAKHPGDENDTTTVNMQLFTIIRNRSEINDFVIKARIIYDFYLIFIIITIFMNMLKVNGENTIIGAEKVVYQL